MKSKSEGNGNKRINEDFNYTKDKMNRDGRNKTERLYRSGSNDALEKIIMYKGLENLWREENLDSAVFTHCNRSYIRGSRIVRVYSGKILLATQRLITK